jgi:hypothetical protein
MPYNLLSYSEDFSNAYWTKSGSSVVSGFAAPDGTTNAFKLVESNSSAIHYIKTPNITVSNSTKHTMSFFAKKGERNIAVRDGSSDAFVSVDLTNNLILDSLGLSTSIQLIGNGWYRITVSYLSTSTICAFQLITLSPSYTSGSPWSSYQGDGTSGAYIYGAQLVKGTSAKTYFPTTTRLNMPRVDYLNNSNGSLILEPQRSNLVTYSSDFSAWTKENVTNGSNVNTSPDGTENADTVIDSATNTRHINYLSFTGNLATERTLSVYAKQNSLRYLFLSVTNSGDSNCYSAIFDLQSGVVSATKVNGSATNSASIQSMGNGWYRCIISGTMTTGTTSFFPLIGTSDRSGFTGSLQNNNAPIYTGSGQSIYLWGAQLEEGSYATTLINTSGSSVTRNADACNITNVADRINSSEGVLYAEIAALDYDGTDRRISLSDGTSNNYITIGYSRFSTNIVAEIVSSGVLQTSDWGATGVTQKNNNKFALSWGSGTMKFYVNGSKTQTKNITSPIGMDDLRFSAANGSLRMFSNTRDLRVYNTALSDSELATLTTL